MKIPKGLQPLIDDGMIDGVVRRLKSGKEASVFIVEAGGELYCAKAYKDAEHRGFHKLAQYQEGRKTRSSRDARALGKGGRHGKRVQESEWKNAEVDALYLLAGVGVRVPKPRLVYEGVLLMELVRDAAGDPAPRLNDLELTPEQAREWHAFMMRQIVLMLCAGLIHGDLSEFNVLVDATGPVIIDLPQAVNAASNNNAFSMLERDVNNMRDTFGRFAPELLGTEYAHEIWALYASSTLRPDSPLGGRFERDTAPPDVAAVLHTIEQERWAAEERLRRRAQAEADG
jgi:RIO kinase 1